MQFNSYPSAIQAAALELNNLETAIAALKHTIQTHEAEADLEVAFDSELKNDPQRKARRTERLLQNQNYQQSIDSLNRLQHDRAYYAIELERLRNEFSVCKLEKKLRIAQLLTGLEVRDLLEA